MNVLYIFFFLYFVIKQFSIYGNTDKQHQQKEHLQHHKTSKYHKLQFPSFINVTMWKPNRWSVCLCCTQFPTQEKTWQKDRWWELCTMINILDTQSQCEQQLMQQSIRDMNMEPLPLQFTAVVDDSSLIQAGEAALSDGFSVVLFLCRDIYCCPHVAIITQRAHRCESVREQGTRERERGGREMRREGRKISRGRGFVNTLVSLEIQRALLCRFVLLRLGFSLTCLCCEVSRCQTVILHGCMS